MWNFMWCYPSSRKSWRSVTLGLWVYIINNVDSGCIQKQYGFWGCRGTEGITRLPEKISDFSAYITNNIFLRDFNGNYYSFNITIINSSNASFVCPLQWFINVSFLVSENIIFLRSYYFSKLKSVNIPLKYN